jgi:hypothetical protein
MNGNNRSNQTIYITTRNQARAAYWLRVFGTDSLPVKNTRPREQWLDDGRFVMAYDLNLSALVDMQLHRFAKVVAKRQGIDRYAAYLELKAMPSWPVDAAGCEVVVEHYSVLDETTAEKRPLSFVWRWFARKRGTEAAVAFR